MGKSEGTVHRASEFHEPEGLRLSDRIGVGRRAQWFKAEQVRLERMVALKFLRPFLATSQAFCDSFIEAGRQAAAIVHPAALPIINVFPKQQCIAMQLCSGRSLKDREGELGPAMVTVVGEAVMDCLLALHATGRRHGNLSAGNVFLDDDGAVWVNDFFQPPVFTDGGRTFLADERFIAPEVLAGSEPDWLSDVFSLGRILAVALRSDSRSDELGMLLEAMQSEEPSQRGGAPEALLAALKRIRRLEEMREGRVSVTSQRGKRMYRRVPAEFAVSLRRRSATPDETAAILMKTRDIGESGVFVETDDAMLNVGSILELDFTLRGVEGNVHAFGIVRWKSSSPMPRGVGVQFVEVDQEGLARLRKFVGNK